MLMMENEIAKQVCQAFDGALVSKFILQQETTAPIVKLIYTGSLIDEAEAERIINTHLAGSSFTVKAQRLNRGRFNILVSSQFVEWYWIRKRPEILFLAKKVQP